MKNLIATPVPHTEAVDMIKGAAPVTREIFDNLLPEFQSRAFTVTGIESVKVLQRVRDLASQLPAGADWDTLKGEILNDISPWLITATDDEGAAEQYASAVRRAELILRNNGWAAYATTNHQAIAAQSDVFPYCEYITSEDSRVRPAHAALNGKIFPTNDPFWQTHTPPWEHGCRCDKVPRLAEDIDELREEEKDLPPENRKVIEGAALAQVRNGQLAKPNGTGFLDIRTPREKNGSGYEFRAHTLALAFDDVLDGYPASAAQAFRQWSAGIDIDGTSLFELLGGSIPKNIPPLPSASIVKRTAPVSKSLALKLRNKTFAKDSIAAIDAVHDDGALPEIPLGGSPGKRYLGYYKHTATGEAHSIAVSASGSWPRLTTVHEIGHFLDHQALGTAGTYASEDPSQPLFRIISLLRSTPTYADILRLAPDTAYWTSGRELFARAYAQYIATVSPSKPLLAELRKCQANPWQPWRQWTDEEFAPIAAEITTLLQQKQWNPTPQP